jgi:hypothetical protein
MSTLTRDARWRTAILALRATHTNNAFEEAVEAGEAGEAEPSEEDGREEDRGAEGAFPKRNGGSIFLFLLGVFLEG